jgi:arginine metabolism regulation protein II
LDNRQIENIIRTIDFAEYNRVGDGRDESIAKTINNFGVFALSEFLPKQDSCKQKVRPRAEDWGEAGELCVDSGSVPESWVNEYAIRDEAEPDSITSDATDLSRITFQGSVATGTPSSDGTPKSSPSEGGTPLCKKNNSEGLKAPTTKLCRWQNHISISSSLDPFTLPTQERYLLKHYIEKVVYLSCVIDNAKSPWKTIHLPRALQSVGQINVEGRTSRIRHALRHDLLSISAFQLSNDHKFHKRDEEASTWQHEASRYRYNAIGLLKQAVSKDLYSQERPKYKDFLATMLSMLSINVSSRLHLVKAYVSPTKILLRLCRGIPAAAMFT